MTGRIGYAGGEFVVADEIAMILDHFLRARSGGTLRARSEAGGIRSLLALQRWSRGMRRIAR